MNKPLLLWKGLLVVLMLTSTGNLSDAYASALDITKQETRLVYENDFSQPQKIVWEQDFIERTPAGSWWRTGLPDTNADWIVEGTGGVEIRGGKLRLSPFPFQGDGTEKLGFERSPLVVWNHRIFPADFLLEFDVDPCGSTNGLAIVFFSATATNGGDIFGTDLPPRRADYKTYHSGAIANYSDSFWSRNSETESVSNRLRKNPGFKLVAQGPSLTTGSTNAPHHVRVLKAGGDIQVEIDGTVTTQWHDPNPLGAGRLGFRTMPGISLFTYQNLKVYQIKARPEAK